MNNTENTRLNPPSSVPQLQEEQDSPSGPTVLQQLSIHREKIFLTCTPLLLDSKIFPAPTEYCANTSDFSPCRSDTSSGCFKDGLNIFCVCTTPAVNGVIANGEKQKRKQKTGHKWGKMYLHQDSLSAVWLLCFHWSSSSNEKQNKTKVWFSIAF